MVGEITTVLVRKNQTLRVEPFDGIVDLRRKIKSAEIYSNVTGEAYELTVSFYDEENIII